MQSEITQGIVFAMVPIAMFWVMMNMFHQLNMKKPVRLYFSIFRQFGLFPPIRVQSQPSPIFIGVSLPEDLGEFQTVFSSVLPQKRFSGHWRRIPSKSGTSIPIRSDQTGVSKSPRHPHSAIHAFWYHFVNMYGPICCVVLCMCISQCRVIS